MPGLFKKLRKKRIENKINRLNSRTEELQGIPEGYFQQPAWDEGGKEVVKNTKKVMDLQNRLKKFKKCGGSVMFCGGEYHKPVSKAVGPNGVL